jgi:hypothetical protein
LIFLKKKNHGFDEGGDSFGKCFATFVPFAWVLPWECHRPLARPQPVETTQDFAAAFSKLL